MTNSRNLSTYGEYALPTDTTKQYEFKPGTGWVVAASGGGAPLLLHVQDQKASGTAGGSTGSTTDYFTRDLNTVVVNQITGASLSSNQVTLPAGTYVIDGGAPSTQLRHKARLYNVSTSARALLGTSERPVDSSTGVGVSSCRSLVRGVVTFATSTIVRLEHKFPGSTGSNDLGVAAFAGDSEVYSDLLIWKLS
jgi:hypothetical protein